MTAGQRTPMAGEDRWPVRLGAILGSTAVGIIIGSFAFSYVYLWANAETWPPEGAEPVPLLLPSLAVALFVGGAVAARSVTARDGLSRHLGLAVSWGAGILGVALLLAAVGGSDLAPTSHAYGSISVLLLVSLAAVGTASAVASLMVQLRLLVGAPTDWLASAQAASTVVWWLTLVVAVMVAATVLAFPHLAAR